MDILSSCHYCGSQVEIGKDHVIPKSFSGNESFIEAKSNPLVYCCRECNSILGNVPLHSVKDRAAYLLTKLKKKYARIIDIPDWTPNELKTLSPTMAKKIKQKEKEKKFIVARVNNLKLTSSGSTHNPID